MSNNNQCPGTNDKSKATEKLIFANEARLISLSVKPYDMTDIAEKIMQAAKKGETRVHYRINESHQDHVDYMIYELKERGYTATYSEMNGQNNWDPTIRSIIIRW